MSSTPETGAVKLLNVNVGVLGHVDSGKTSLVSALSTTLSTAALDKHPQSKQRGITLDLGFSSFQAPIPDRLSHLKYDGLQFTLVDCPGHASLIRTVLGGAQIIDMMILVVDVTKGIQAQTAECIVVGELTTDNLVIALNKVDLLPPETRDKQVSKAAKRLKATFAATKFAASPVIPVSAKGIGAPTGGDGAPEPYGMEPLVAELVARVQPPAAPAKGFLFGDGAQRVGEGDDTLELPELKIQKKVKSMQMFKQPVQKVARGDRAGICVTKLDASLMERGLASSPGLVPTFSAAIASVEKIRFYAGVVSSGTKFNVTIGHTAALAEVTFFGLPPGKSSAVHSPEEAMALAAQNLMALTTKDSRPPPFDFEAEYLYQEELYGLEGRPRSAEGPAAVPSDSNESDAASHHGPQWALLKFDRAVTVPQDSLLIGARFDMDNSSAACRLALYGRLLAVVICPNDTPSENTQGAKELKALRVYKPKQKVGSIERVNASRTGALCKNLLKKETDISPFLGLKVIASGGEEGVIESSFGKSGKFNVRFPGGLAETTGKPNTSTITLNFKRYMFDEQAKRAMVQ
eukprot:CAMPEP_0177580092 /NCGR_PEP_ID=MMETSP0419_2-20121207/1355_1 /TAXON_ID=582737 /ORGANISM="Tetraselmis sp., Strain GSL018" /LENGTH=575 /DNA_ID=CAMNT_0019068895 /DNA_START=52 /DNA_END=1783 /DNA_ORIENTATION=+